MTGPLRAALEQALGAEIRSETPLSGGSIATVRRLELDGVSREGHRTAVVKTTRGRDAGTEPAADEKATARACESFRCEAQGLRALAAVLEPGSATGGPGDSMPDAGPVPGEGDGLGFLRVPKVLAVGRAAEASGAYLLLEWIEPGRRPDDFSRRFGEALAALHARGTGTRFGFEHDNLLGSTRQTNTWSNDPRTDPHAWTTFWRTCRLEPQLERARRSGRGDAELFRRGAALASSLEEFLSADKRHAEPPCLLHGDLWGGNYLVDTEGRAVLIDPAVSYGHREAELAMTRLFGGFDDEFAAAYEAAWPLAPGARERGLIYELYHLLNHLNLFGTGYLEPCLDRLRRLT